VYTVWVARCALLRVPLRREGLPFEDFLKEEKRAER